MAATTASSSAIASSAAGLSSTTSTSAAAASSSSGPGLSASSSNKKANVATPSPKHFDISQLPSLIKDGLTAEEESTRRRKTCRFIEEAGRLLKLPRVAVATAMVFFHRFYAKHSFNEHDRFEVAVASIVLAGKTEECPKKLHTVIDECYKLKQKGMQAGRISQQGSGAAVGSMAMMSLDPNGKEFKKLKERILLLERVILHTIGFELSIDHPYRFLVEQIKKLEAKRKLEYIDPPKSLSNQFITPDTAGQLIQYSMNFANDSMHTSLCLQFSAQLIAVSCVYLAGHFLKVRPTENKSWMEALGYPDPSAMVSIGLQIIDCITERKGSDNPTYNKIRAELEKLTKADSTTPSSTDSSNKAPPPPKPPSGGAPPAKRQRT